MKETCYNLPKGEIKTLGIFFSLLSSEIKNFLYSSKNDLFVILDSNKCPKYEKLTILLPLLGIQ